MNRRFKIFLSIVVVCAVAIFVARAFWPRPVARPAHKPPVKLTVKAKKPVTAHPRMAIILDDWGLNASLVDDAVAVGRPLTLSVLPRLKHSRDIAQSAHAAGLGVMLHMPMQAKSATAPREPHTLLTTSSDAEILGYLEEAFESVPFAEGLNNHQGSAATSDPRVMHTLLSRLKQKGFFFVDSQVVSTSVGWKVAEELGIRFARRQVFLDNVATVAAVKKQLEAAVKIALEHGGVVAIGHDKKSTIEAIREMVPEIERKGIKLVLVRDLLQ